MAQKLRDDKIGTLSQSSGIITMSASTSIPVYLTIGGQQYKITSSLSRTISTDISMGINQLYMIYAVRNSGNTELRISSNVNSTGPSGFASWLLVGAFYSNGSNVFGGFVTITGIPMSDEISYSPTLQSSGGGNITLNATGVINPYGYWQRIGNQMKMYAGFRNGTAGTATGTAGGVMIGLPSGLTGTTSRSSDGNFGTAVGAGPGYIPAVGSANYSWYFVYNGVTLSPIKLGTGSVLSVSDIVAQTSLNLDVTFGMLTPAWTNTPLKDL
jgi:hypothetical protein